MTSSGRQVTGRNPHSWQCPPGGPLPFSHPPSPASYSCVPLPLPTPPPPFPTPPPCPMKSISTQAFAAKAPGLPLLKRTSALLPWRAQWKQRQKESGTHTPALAGFSLVCLKSHASPHSTERFLSQNPFDPSETPLNLPPVGLDSSSGVSALTWFCRARTLASPAPTWSWSPEHPELAWQSGEASVYPIHTGPESGLV